MAWHFPTKTPFDLHLANGRLLVGCRLVGADEQTFTVDYDQLESFGRLIRVRGQFRIDMLIHLAERAPFPLADIPAPAPGNAAYLGP